MPTRYGVHSALLLTVLFVLCVGFEAALGLTPRGNWVIDGKETLSDATAIFEGNITIMPGAELTVTASVLIFNCTNASRYGVIVKPGGRLAMTNVRLTTINASEGFWFECHGAIEARSCRIEHVFSDVIGSEWAGGFRITSDNPVVENCIFDHTKGFGVRFDGCRSIVFRGNLVTQASTGLVVNASSGVVADNLFWNNSDRHVVISNSNGVDFTNNKLNETGLGALIMSACDNIRTAHNRYEGEFYVVYAKNARVEMQNERLSGGQIHIESIENSRITLIDCLLEKERVNALSGSRVEMMRQVTVWAGSGAGGLSGVIVTVRDQAKTMVGEGMTAEDGTVRLLVSEFTVTESGLQLRGPFEFRGVKGIYSGRVRAEIPAGGLVKVKMGLPWLFIGIGAAFLVLVLIIVFRPPAGGRKRSRRSGRG